LELKECTAQTAPQAAKCPLDPKRQTDKHPLEQKGQSKTQLKTTRRKATEFVQRLRAILLRLLRKPQSQEKTIKEPEECKCSICKKNKGAVQGTLEPLKTHIPVLMKIRSIRIDQEKHRIPNTRMIQEDGQPNR